MRSLWREHIFCISQLWLFSHFIYIHCLPPSYGRIKQQFYSLGKLAHHSLHFKWNIKQDPSAIVITITSIYTVLDKVFLFSLECYLYYSYNFLWRNQNQVLHYEVLFLSSILFLQSSCPWMIDRKTQSGNLFLILIFLLMKY